MTTTELNNQQQQAAAVDPDADIDWTQEETETTREEALKSLLTDDELSDLSLRGSDGVLVLANRCLLASRSPVFRRMLYGQFKEAFDSVIDVGYTGQVLQVIVEYIYTDTIPKGGLVHNRSKSYWDIEYAQFLVTLMTAANYFALPELCKQIETIAIGGLCRYAPCNMDYIQFLETLLVAANTYSLTGLREKLEESSDGPLTDSWTFLWDINCIQVLMRLLITANHFRLPDLRERIEQVITISMTAKPDIATFVLAACPPSECDESTTKVLLQKLALETVKRFPTIIVSGNKPVIAQIHPSYIENIVKDDNLPMTESSCFQILNSWAHATTEEEDDNSNNDKEGDIFLETNTTSRKRIAGEMTKYINFRNIDLEELATTVSASGLVTTEQLNNANRLQSLRSRNKQRRMGGIYSMVMWRRKPVWKESGATIFEHKLRNNSDTATSILDCPPMKSGVHKWAVKVLKGSTDLHIGVASMHYPITTTTCLGMQRGGWALYDGIAMNDCRYLVQDKYPQYSNGSIVTFTLDLTATTDGTLSASFDGKTPPVELFSGMLYLQHRDGVSFVPAVSVSRNHGDRVEFLGFQDVT